MKKPNQSFKDKALFTPGPLSTSPTIKQSMLRDLGSRDQEFIQVIREIRSELLFVAGVDSTSYTTVLMQGSGTFCVESVLTSIIPADGKLLILSNGAYGKRIAQMADVLKISKTVLEFEENTPVDPKTVREALSKDSTITDVAIVHCETTSGLYNNIEAVGKICAEFHKTYFVDAMSSFGAVPIDLEKSKIDYIVSSANKCIEGVPGFAFAVCRKDKLMQCEGRSRSLSLDLFAQWKGLENSGQFRFTPPTHVLLAFRQALRELTEEGGVAGRSARYQENYQTLLEGMRPLGFREFLKPEDQGYIITSFYYPKDPAFKFEAFYERLSDLGFVIYPGKVGKADCFRIGNIGRIQKNDVVSLTMTIEKVLKEMGVKNAN